MLKKTGKLIQIRLDEEKFYFPGETIQEKQVTSLFEAPLTLYANESHKQAVLVSNEEHVFGFQFRVPSELKLPSSMQFGKKCFVRYTISAVLNRPMIPESLCPQCEYDVSLLEYIDIDQPQLKVAQEKTAQVSVANQKCIVKASMPRIGFTRGDVIPLTLVVTHVTPCSRRRSIGVELVRHLEIRTAKHTVSKETVLKSTDYDLTIVPPSLQQTVHCPLLIPTSTPPTIRYLDKLLRFHYRVRVRCRFTESAVANVPLPIILGTWPRAAIPIEEEEYGDEMSLDIQSIMTQELVNRSNSVKSYNSISSLNSWENKTSRPSVPTHVLEPIPSPSPIPVVEEGSTSEEDSEDDLLVLLKKKKRREQRQTLKTADGLK
ncbi:hypothetical protein BY458DRAFT_444994 [Sporodiniella umbellata]|nr:hypothetical protein BY458DRAFT_444994 [Sporodiniella umbellata]